VVFVDDASQDGTGAIAGEAAASIGVRDRLSVLHSGRLSSEWTGKAWALKQGIDAAAGRSPQPVYLLLTDADITFAPDMLKRVVNRAETGRFVLTSVMAKPRCQSLAARSFIPAFVFFFQMLCPFSWVNRADRATAAAAGACMLVRRDALAGHRRHRSNSRRVGRRLRAC
jgi:glycosyltransferase involved in cell wall biosynthesis